MSQPLNVIFITSDEMRGDVPSFMGNPDCRTPNIDRFAEKGVRFRQHFSVHGKCVPSRIAMVSGRYSHTDGYRTVNKTNHLPPGTPNLLTAVKAAGYETASFGHNHKWEDHWGKLPDRSDSCVDYHSYSEGHFDDLIETVHPIPEPGPDAATILDTPDNCLRVSRITEPRSGFMGDNRALQARRYLKEKRDRSRPFCLFVDFGLPHPGYSIEEPYFSMYDRDAITPFEHGIGENAPLHLRKMHEIRGAHATEARLRQLQAVYYGMCSKVDYEIGQVLQAIDEENLWDNTVVVFTTDHGDFASQYSLPEKWDTAMNDCILHVPCILHAPRLQGDRWVETLTEHTDLAPTLLELLGLEADWVMHGQSLLPIIEGEVVKHAVFADGGHEKPMRDRFNQTGMKRDADGRDNLPTHGKQAVYEEFPDSMARTKMVRTDRWKLVIRETGGNELYDMSVDPNEMDNVYGRDGTMEVTNDLMLKLIEWCLRTDTDLPYQERVGA